MKTVITHVSLLLKPDFMQQTIQHLTDIEVRKFRKQLQTQNKNELLALFNLLYENPEPFTENQIEGKIYGIESGSRKASMLKNYLKETLLDFLISYRMLHKHPVLDKKFIARVRIKKRLAQYTLLNNSGRNLPFAHQLLDEVISESKKWENYTDLVYALDQQKQHFGFTNGKKEFEKWSKEMQHYERCIAATSRAVHYYNELNVFIKSKGNPDSKSVLKIIKECLKDMKHDYQLTRLPVILYYQQKIKVEYFCQHKQYKKAKQVCIDTLNLLKKYPALNDSQRTGYAHDYLAQCNMALGEYKEAMKHFSFAQKNILKGTVNYLISKEQEFLLLFYDRQYAKAKQTVETLLKNLPADTEQFRIGKLNFYHACSLLKVRRHSLALKILRQKTELFKDKAGWIFSSKLVEIMVLYEMKNTDEIKLTFKRLRDFVRYNKKAFTERDKVLLLILNHLMNCNFHPVGKYKRRIRKLVALLKDKRKPYQWLPFSHELIRFEDWVESGFL